MTRPAGMSGGRVLRAVGRAVGTGAEAVSGARSAWTTKPARSASFTSSASSTVSSPAPPASPNSSTTASSSFVATAESQQLLVHSWFLDEWAFVWDDYGGDKEERMVFGPAPTKEEAEDAVATIQQIFLPPSFSQAAEDDQFLSSSNGIEGNMTISTSTTDITEQNRSFEIDAKCGSDWIEPSQSLISSRALQSSEHENNVFDALQLLAVNPAIQKIVVSLSSDKAVWDAVMKNDVVQEIKKSISEGKSINSENTDDRQSHVPPGLLNFVENIMARFSELVDNIGKLVRNILHVQQKNIETSKPFDLAVKTSFMLSVMAFIVIVVGRLRRA